MSHKLYWWLYTRYKNWWWFKCFSVCQHSLPFHLIHTYSIRFITSVHPQCFIFFLILYYMCIHRQFPYINICVKFKFCTGDMRKWHKALATTTVLQNGSYIGIYVYIIILLFNLHDNWAVYMLRCWYYPDFACLSNCSHQSSSPIFLCWPDFQTVWMLQGRTRVLFHDQGDKQCLKQLNAFCEVTTFKLFLQVDFSVHVAFISSVYKHYTQLLSGTHRSINLSDYQNLISKSTK